MDPIIIPPLLYKNYDEAPLRDIWTDALETLRECRLLVVVGYSFPPTDFRSKRLFREAFANTHHLEHLVVVNPDASVLDAITSLTQFSGETLHYRSLSEAYGTPQSWPSKQVLPGLVIVGEGADLIEPSQWVRGADPPKPVG